MSTAIALPRPPVARLAGALLALTLLAAGCGESSSEPDSAAPSGQASGSGAASDGGGASGSGGASAAGGASDGGAASADGGASEEDGQAAAAVPQDPYPVTPAPEGFAAPAPCSGEGAYFAEVGGTATPGLPERAGETLSVQVVGIDGDKAQLAATVGDGSSRPIEDITLGETATIDLWTISVTSICEDTQQVEFDLID